MNRKVIIEECGNGFPGKGDYVSGADGLWRITSIGRIHTGECGSGQSNYAYGRATRADWSDCAEWDEFPAHVTEVKS